MAGEDDKSKKEPAKGFAGLSELVSKIDAATPASGKPALTPSASSESTQRTSPPPVETAPTAKSVGAKPYEAPPEPSSGGSATKWMIGISIVIGIFWLIGESDRRGSSRPAASYPSGPAQAPGSLVEAMPPVGQGMVFTTAQIRYCLAEEIRINAAETVLNNYSDYDVDRYNAMVADYNSRCSNYRYRRGALEGARRDVEPYRSQLVDDGRGRLSRNPSAGPVTPPTQVGPIPDATVQAAQRQLNVLGYQPGPADGLMGRSTRWAVQAFQRDIGVPTTGVVDALLITQLQQVPSRPVRARAPSSGDVQLTSEETASLEAACSSDKYLNGPAAYQACAERQRAALASGSRRPDLSSLSGAERQSIEAACSQDKYLNGPASYNQCLVRQLAAFSGAETKRPDLSRLSSPERQSIEAACSQDKYLNGPAAYNRCLNSQLDALERQGGRPDLSMLSSAERTSIESACSTDKYLNGPAAYNRCLTRQLTALRN